MAKLAFLGLGVMGYPMAGHLQAGGHEVTVYNRTSKKAQAWVKQHKGAMAATVAEAVKNAEVVFACVGADQDVFAITLGDNENTEAGAFSAMAKGSVFVDNTTASAGGARKLSVAASERGIGFVDAPVSGGQAGAEGGKLTVMCGGEAEVVGRVKPLMECYAAKVVHIGASGSGQLAKMVNQICIAGVLQGLAEAIHFGQCANLDIEKVLEAVAGGAAQSWQMDNRAATMAANQFDFGFAMDWMVKDLTMCLEEAAKNGSTLPVTALVNQYYRQLAGRGYGREDTSALIRLLR